MNNIQSFQQMVQQRVQRQLTAAADREANRIVANLTRNHKTGALAPQPAVAPVMVPGAASVKRVRIRDRGSLRHQFAPKGSWLSLGRAPRGAKPVTGQLAIALTVAEQALAAGPADRATLTKLMANATPGWTAVTASGCISRLVAAGRLAVVSAPRSSS